MQCLLTPSGAQSKVYQELSKTMSKEIALRAYNFLNNSKYFDYQSQLIGLNPITDPLRYASIAGGFGINIANTYPESHEPRVWYLTSLDQVDEPTDLVPSYKYRVSDTHVPNSIPVFLSNTPINGLVDEKDITYFTDNKTLGLLESDLLSKDKPVLFYDDKTYIRPELSSKERQAIQFIKDNQSSLEPLLSLTDEQKADATRSSSTPSDIVLNSLYLAYKTRKSKVADYINSNLTRGQDANNDGIVKTVRDSSDEIEFDNTVQRDENGNPIYNPATGNPQYNHTYTDKATATTFDTSVTAIKNEYEYMQFEKAEYFLNKIKTSASGEYKILRKFLTPPGQYATEAEIEHRMKMYVHRLFQWNPELILEDFPALISNEELNKYRWLNENNRLVYETVTPPRVTDPYAQYSSNDLGYIAKGDERRAQYESEYDDPSYMDFYEEDEYDENGNPIVTPRTPPVDQGTTYELSPEQIKESVLHDFRLATRTLQEDLRNWELDAELGTKVHALMESIFKEDTDRTSIDDKNLKYLNETIPQLAQENEAKLREFVASLNIDDELLNDPNTSFDTLYKRVANYTYSKGEKGGNNQLLEVYRTLKLVEEYFPNADDEYKQALYLKLGQFYQNDKGQIVILDKIEADNMFYQTDAKDILTANGFWGTVWHDSKGNSYSISGVGGFTEFNRGISHASTKYAIEYANKLTKIKVTPFYVQELYKNLLELKKSIKDRGGIIMTEINTHSDQVVTIDGTSTMRVAGRLDMLAVFPATNTGEIYDFKTMKSEFINKTTLFATGKRVNLYDPVTKKKIGFYTPYSGYTPKKQAEHAFQLLFYKNALELKTGIKITDVFIVPIYVKSKANTSEGAKATSVIKINEHTPRKRGNDHRFAINLREWMTQHHTDGTFTYPSYRETEELVESRFAPLLAAKESKDTLDEGKAIKRETARIRDEKVITLVEDIRIYVADQLRTLQHTRDSKESKDRRDRLYAMQTELEYVTDIEVLVKFIISSEDEIENLSKRLNDALLKYETNELGLQGFIAELDTLRIYLEGYGLLDEIKAAVPEELITPAYNATIEKKATLLNIVENKLPDLISERLAQYISSDATNAANDYINAITARREHDLEQYNKDLAKATNDKERIAAEKGIKNMTSELERIAKNTAALTLDVKTIKKEMREITKDIGFFQRYLLGASSTSDPILSLYSKMLKFEISNAELELQQELVTFQQAMEKIGLQVEYNTERFFEPIVEKRLKWIKNDKGVSELQEEYALLSKYGTRTHTPLGTTEPLQLSYSQIQKNFEFSINALRKERKLKEAAALRKQFDDWKRNEMMPEFTQKYYDIENILDNNPDPALNQLGKDIRAELDLIADKILDIKEGADYDANLTEHELFSIKQYKFERKQIGSLYDENGNMKTGPALAKAELYQSYLKRVPELYDIDSNRIAYEKKRREIIGTYGENSSEHYKFLVENENSQHTDAFYTHYKRLTSERDLEMAYREEPATFADIHYELMSGNNEHTDEEFNHLFEQFLDTYEAEHGYRDIRNTDNPFEELFNEAKQKLKPYSIDGEVDPTLMEDKRGDEVRQRIKDIDFEIENAVSETEEMDREERDNMIQKAQEYADLNNRVKAFADQVPTNTYFRKFYEELAKHNNDVSRLEKSKWFQDNHILIKRSYSKDPLNPLVPKYKPIRIWTRLAYVGGEKRVSTSYMLDRQAELTRIKQDFSYTPSAQALENALKKTLWFKMHHNELTGELNDDDPVYYELAEDDQYVNVNLSHDFDTYKIKEEHIPADSYDKFGNLLPIESQWGNEKYNRLKYSTEEHDQKMFKFLELITDLYQKAQDKLPLGLQVSLQEFLPMLDKTATQYFAESKGILNKTWAFTKQKFKDAFGNLMKDEVNEGDPEMSRMSIDGKQLSMAFTKHMPIDQVSTDVLASVVTFAKFAFKRHALSNILAETKSLLSVINKRDIQNGVPETDAQGNKYLNSTAKLMGINRNVYKKKMTNMNALITDHVLTQVLNEHNTPIDYAIPRTNKVIRVDKVADTLMGLASFTQIGGLTPVAWMKGLANSLQASLQLHIEMQAREFFAVKTWKLAKKRFLYDEFGYKKLVYDDFGKVTATSRLGQLMNIYDAMQGDFYDKAGNKVSGKLFNNLVLSDVWFSNQYIGEMEVAATTLIAYLSSHKIINGEVKSLKQYLQDRRDKLGVKTLTARQEDEAYNEFEDIKENLYDSLIIGADGKIKVKEGVNWTLGSMEDNEIKNRLRSINTSLQGAYSSWNKNTIQKGVGGRFLMMYKKYLAPGLRRRWGSLTRNEERGDINYGYYRNLFSLMWTDFRALGKELMNILISSKLKHKSDSGLSSKERANVRRAMREIMLWLLLLAIVYNLAPGDDEDKDDITGGRWLALYEFQRLAKEVGAFIPFPTAFHDNWKVLSNPSAINSMVTRMHNLSAQMLHPFEVYEKETSYADKGDSKLYVDLLKLMGNLANASNAKEAYENLQR